MITVGIYIQDLETLNYNRIDLFDDEKISVVSSIQNINDISKTFTDFSQTFTVPASKQNNKIFKHWYENSNENQFSTLTKSNAYIEIDTIPFRKGKIQLESANVIDGQAQDYSITFVGILGNLKDIFAGKYLKDLTSTAYDFNYTANEVLSRVVDNIASRPVMFPLISSNRVWNVNPTTFNADAINWQSAPIRYNELFPAIRVVNVFDMIETEFGIDFEGTFLDDSRFQNAYLYLKNAETFTVTEQKLKVNFTSITGYSSPNSIGYTFDLTNDKVTNTEAVSSISGYNFVRKDLYFILTPSVSNIQYKINIYKNGFLYYDSGILTSVSGTAFSYLIESTTNRFATNNYYEFYILTKVPFSFSTDVKSNMNMRYYPLGGPYIYRDYYADMLSASQTTSTYLLPIPNYMPEIKIEDFFSGILKMFNLTCYSTDGINYTVEQLESYYGSGNDIDITKYVIQDKKALNRVKTYKRINFEYEKSESFVNVAFESNAGIPYGTLRYVNNPPTEGEEYSIKLPFENLNFQNLFTNSLFQVGYTLKTDLSNYIPKPIILYDYNSAGTTNAGFTFYTSGALDGNGDPRTSYKAFGQETLANNDTWSLNFPPQQSTLTNLPVTNGLYKSYYENYFSNIYNFKARLVKVSAILPTSILTTLKLNDNIIIRDAKYIINTMNTDITTGVVQFELLTDQRL